MENVEQVDQGKKSPFKFVLPIFILLIIGILGFGVYEYFRIAPRDVRFTNVTSSSVTVSWNTKSPTSATVLVFEGDTFLPLTILGLGGERFYDTRDVRVAELRAVQETSTNLFNDDELGVSMEDISTEIEVVNMGEYYTHHVSIAGLDSEKVYSLMVGDIFLYTKASDVSGTSTVETLAVPDSVEAPIPAYGTIKNAQNSEDPEMLAPVSDGVVYFNLMDELSGNKSNVYSGALNEEGNWYIDISGIRVEDGEDFLSGEVIANVVGEISIDAGPDGKWEGVLNTDIMAPAEMIVINDPLQMQIEGVGIKKVESHVLGDFTFDTEAAGCTFAGYCGPCYDGVLTNPCTCPQSALDGRPGCKGQEDGTMEEVISAVAKQTTQDGGECSNGGKPGAHVYFEGSCRECIWDTNRGGYLWTTFEVEDADCNDTSGRVIQPTVVEEEEEEDECSPDTSQSLIRVGAKCCRSGKVGVGRITTIRGVSDGFESVKGIVNNDTAPAVIYCDISGSTGPGAFCDVNNGRGRETSSGCSAYDCDDGYELSYNGISARPLMVCVEEEEEVVDPEEIDVDCRNLDNRGKVCRYVPPGAGSAYGGTAYYCSGTGDCVKDGGSCYIDPRYRTKTGEYRGGICVEIEPTNPVSVETEEEALRHECFEKGWFTVLYLADSKGNLYRCFKGQLEEISSPSVNDGNNEDRCLALNKTPQSSVWCWYDVALMHYCYVESQDIVYYCGYVGGGGGKGVWRAPPQGSEFASAKVVNIPARATVDISPGAKCNAPEGNTCWCNGHEVQRNNYCKEADSCVKNGAAQNQGEICKEDTEKWLCYYGECWRESAINNYEGIRGVEDVDMIGKLRNIIPKVEADSDEYILDQEMGVLEYLEAGTYTFIYEGQRYVYDVPPGFEGSVIFIDRNNNNIYDEGIDLKVSEIASLVKIISMEKSYKFSLSQGFNFVSFPFLLSEEGQRTAAGLLKELNSIYGDKIFSISRYEGGRWKIVGQNTILYGNDDFQLLPGEGYVIKVKNDLEIRIPGKPIKYDSSSDTAPVTLFEGWNLVGLYGTGVKTYTAKTMIADINASNFTADNVSRWEKEKQMYEGFQFSEDQEYGFDFPINSLESVFVRVLEGRGNWQPKLRSQ